MIQFVNNYLQKGITVEEEINELVSITVIDTKRKRLVNGPEDGLGQETTKKTESCE